MLRVPLLARAVSVQQPALNYTSFSSDEKELYNRLSDESKETIEKLHTLEFFAYLRDGTRIPAKKLGETVASDASVLIETMQRLITVVEAVFPGDSSYYWRQAFYLSSGTSSDMGGTWLPFDGICTRGGQRGTLFYKKPFAGGDRDYQSFGTNENSNKKSLFKRFYEYIYLPESYGPLGTTTLPLFDRFGTYSYLLASHTLGGNRFKTGYSIRSLNTNNSGIRLDEIEMILMSPSPLPESIQIKKQDTADFLEINAFIDKFKASSWHQAFRSLHIPILAELSTIPPQFSYPFPHELLLDRFIDEIHKLYYKHKIQGIVLETIQKEISTKLEELKENTLLTGGGKRKTRKTRKGKSKKYTLKKKLRKLQRTT